MNKKLHGHSDTKFVEELNKLHCRKVSEINHTASIELG